MARYQQVALPHQSFENYQTQGKPESVLLAFRASMVFAREPKGFLVLHGPSGTGKTHLAAAICNYQRALQEDKRQLTLFLVVADLLDMLRSGYKSGDYEELLELCMTVDILLLDDLGVEKESDWAAEKLFQIVNHRYNHQLPLFVATNKPLDDLEPRIYSRLSDDDLSVRVNVMAPDHRQRLSNPGAIAW
jgi:DNA replication protein DnaC